MKMDIESWEIPVAGDKVKQDPALELGIPKLDDGMLHATSKPVSTRYQPSWLMYRGTATDYHADTSRPP